MDLVKEARLIAQGRREFAQEIASELEYALQSGCGEDMGAERNFARCGLPAEFILWGKRIPPEGLGPRCYEHAARHVSDYGLVPRSGWAVLDLRPLRRALKVANGELVTRLREQ